jgi:hypothetical protein
MEYLDTLEAPNSNKDAVWVTADPRLCGRTDPEEIFPTNTPLLPEVECGVQYKDTSQNVQFEFIKLQGTRIKTPACSSVVTVAPHANLNVTQRIRVGDPLENALIYELPTTDKSWASLVKTELIKLGSTPSVWEGDIKLTGQGDQPHSKFSIYSTTTQRISPTPIVVHDLKTTAVEVLNFTVRARFAVPLIHDTHMSLVVYCGPTYSVSLAPTSRPPTQYASHLVSDGDSFILPDFVPQYATCPILDRSVTWSNWTVWEDYTAPVLKSVDKSKGYLWLTGGQ